MFIIRLQRFRIIKKEILQIRLDKYNYSFYFRKFYWKLIYFVALEKKLYDSRQYLAINSSRLDLTWDNVYHTRYSVSLTSSTSQLWRYYYGFHLYTSNTLTTKQLQDLETSLLHAWYNMSLGMYFS